MGRGIAVAVVLIGASLLGAGCGEKSPREQFVANGDAVCKRLAARLEHLALTPTSLTPGAILGHAAEYHDLTRALSTALSASKRPDGDADASGIVRISKRLTSEARRTKVIAKRIAAAAARRDGSAEGRGRTAHFAGVARILGVARALDRRLRAYGFARCGQPGSFTGAAEALDGG
jgi:hypothetical protein